MKVWDEIKYFYYIWRAGGSDNFLLDIILIGCLVVLLLPLVIF